MNEGRSYQFHEALGKGGFGVVYRATMRGAGGFETDVAVKVLNPDMERFAEVTQRLRDEARLLGLVRHRAVLHVTGLVQIGDRWGVVMEYVPGADLRSIARVRRMPPRPALEVLEELAHALQYCFTKKGPEGRPLGIIHRDIKPANIQLARHGEVKLLDFGIARADWEARESETKANVIMGSRAYLSPERLMALDTPAGDVYALGCTAFEIVMSERFGRTSASREDHEAKVVEATARLRDLTEGEVPGFADLVADMLAFEAAKRPTYRHLISRCRELRSAGKGPYLAEWAEDNMTAVLLRRKPPAEAELCGVTLSENGSDRLTGETSLGSLGSSEAQTALDIRGESSSEPTAVPALYAGLAGGVGVLALAAVCAGVSGVTLLLTEDPVASTTSGEPIAAPVDAVAPAPDEPVGVSPPAAAEAPPPRKASPEPVAVAAAAEAVAPEKPASSKVVVADRSAPALDTPAAALGTKAGVRVTAGDFAAWLKTHPDWTRDAAIANGRASDGYLSDWTTQGPASLSAPAVNVSWWAANAYCANHGGLATLTDQPTSWSEAGGVFQEWRSEGMKAGWVRFDGQSSTVVRRTDANEFTGVRCRK